MHGQYAGEHLDFSLNRRAGSYLLGLTLPQPNSLPRYAYCYPHASRQHNYSVLRPRRHVSAQRRTLETSPLFASYHHARRHRPSHWTCAVPVSPPSTLHPAHDTPPPPPPDVLPHHQHPSTPVRRAYAVVHTAHTAPKTHLHDHRAAVTRALHRQAQPARLTSQYPRPSSTHPRLRHSP